MKAQMRGRRNSMRLTYKKRDFPQNSGLYKVQSLALMPMNRPHGFRRLPFLAVILFLIPVCFLLSGFAQSAEPSTSHSSVHESDLHRAARTGDLALLRAQLQLGADPNERDSDGRTPLMDAVAAGKISSMRVLLSAKANVNAHANSGRTALIEAAAQGNMAATRLLIQSGADLNGTQRGWGSAVKTAERMGHPEIAEVLLKAGAKSSGSSVGDKVCVRPWSGNGYCGTVESVNKNDYRIRVTEIVGCRDGCPARQECSEGRAVGGSYGINIGDEINTVSWCLTQTGVKP